MKVIGVIGSFALGRTLHALFPEFPGHDLFTAFLNRVALPPITESKTFQMTSVS